MTVSSMKMNAWMKPMKMTSNAFHADKGQGQGAEARDQADHDRAGKDVSKQPERQRHWLHKLFQDVQRRVDRTTPDGELERFGEAAQVAAPAKNPDAVPLDNTDHDQSHGQRLIEVGVGAVQDRENREGQNLDPVR